MHLFLLLWALVFASFDISCMLPGPQELYVTENILSGTQLVLSDGSSYEIAPEDRPTASAWLSPVTVLIGQSNDTVYPLTLTNQLANSVVLAKKC